MKIGLLSDTHNHVKESRRALDLLLANGAEHLVHCGDIGEDVLGLMTAVCMETGVAAHVALGNCDAYWAADIRYLPQSPALHIGRFLAFELAGISCAVIHGDHTAQLNAAVEGGEYAYVFTGHTHRASAKQTGRTWLVNPGSPVSPRQGVATVATVDLSTEKMVWLPCE